MTLEEGKALRARLAEAYRRVEKWRRLHHGPAPSLATILQAWIICAGDDMLDAMERKYERDKSVLRSA